MKRLKTIPDFSHPQTVVALIFAFLSLGGQPAIAQELLANRSFENPVAPADGNNFYESIDSWTLHDVVPAQAQPFNIVKPWSGYTGNPVTTPTGGGAQYFDVTIAAGVLRQNVSVTSQGMLDFSGWYSVRDYQQNLSDLTINIRDSGGAVIASVSTRFFDTDPIGLWKQVIGANIPVTAGTYTFEAIIPDNANFDLASLIFKPGLSVSKTSKALSDPINDVVSPKRIPGGVVEYLISATTPGAYSATSNSIVVTDTTPANMELVITDIGGTGSGPAVFNAGTTGLTHNYGSLASMSDDIDFSNDGGASWTYAPVANGSGTDPNVTTIRLRPQGAMAASSTMSYRLRYRLK